LRDRVALLRRSLEPLECRRIVLRDALALGKQSAQRILGGRIALFSKRLP